MAYGDFLYPGASTYPDTTTYPGQGLVPKPELSVLLSFDDASAATPAYQDVTALVRAFGTSRGRENELAEISAGTATVTFDNRGRFFEPGSSSPVFPSATTYPGASTYPGSGNARPMNRLWIRELFGGTVNTVFQGYAEGYDYSWEKPGTVDETATGSFVDEFKVLAQGRLPRMTSGVTVLSSDKEPVNYAEVVATDTPDGYWSMNDDNALLKQHASPGADLIHAQDGGSADDTTGAIVGDRASPSCAQTITAGNYYTTYDLNDGYSGNFGGLSEASVEFWFKASDATPLGSNTIIQGPASGAGDDITRQWKFILNTGGTLACRFRKTGGTDVTVTSTTVLQDNTYYHVFGCVRGANLLLYINGVQEASTAFGAVIIRPISPDVGDADVRVGHDAATVSLSFDEIAVYRTGLTAARILAHYVAGTQRGFGTQRTDLRIAAVLDAAGSQLSRSFRTGNRNVMPRFMHGQEPMSEITPAVQAEAKDTMFYVGRPVSVYADIGAVPHGFVFLNADHRSFSPWNTVQATFSDTGEAGYLPYLDATTDYGDSFLKNTWIVSREGGSAQTATDASSIARYYERPESLSGLQVSTDFDALSIATLNLGKYKEPFHRITSLVLDTSIPEVTDAVFRLDLGDRIRVIKTLPGGGWLDQQLFIQRISVEAENTQTPWRITLGVSPL